MTPSLAEPPTPQRFFRRPASARTPASSSGRLEIVVTVLPRRPAVSRRTVTRPPPPAGARCGARRRRRSPSSLDQTGLLTAPSSLDHSAGSPHRGCFQNARQPVAHGGAEHVAAAAQAVVAGHADHVATRRGGRHPERIALALDDQHG